MNHIPYPPSMCLGLKSTTTASCYIEWGRREKIIDKSKEKKKVKRKKSKEEKSEEKKKIAKK